MSTLKEYRYPLEDNVCEELLKIIYDEPYFNKINLNNRYTDCVSEVIMSINWMSSQKRYYWGDLYRLLSDYGI